VEAVVVVDWRWVSAKPLASFPGAPTKAGATRHVGANEVRDGIERITSLRQTPLLPWNLNHIAEQQRLILVKQSLHLIRRHGRTE